MVAQLARLADKSIYLHVYDFKYTLRVPFSCSRSAIELCAGLVVCERFLSVVLEKYHVVGLSVIILLRYMISWITADSIVKNITRVKIAILINL